MDIRKNLLSDNTGEAIVKALENKTNKLMDIKYQQNLFTEGVINKLAVAVRDHRVAVEEQTLLCMEGQVDEMEENSGEVNSEAEKFR